MRHHNSPNIGVYTELLVGAYHDLVSAILPQNEIERDIEEIRKRAHHEGIAFLTKTLPSLGKSIDNAMANGSILAQRGFKTAEGSELPRFAAKLFRTLFRNDGLPWFATTQPGVLYSLRQVLVGDDPDPVWENQAGSLVQIAREHDESVVGSLELNARDDDYCEARNNVMWGSEYEYFDEARGYRHTVPWLVHQWFGTRLKPEADIRWTLANALREFGFRDSVLNAWRGDPTCSGLREEAVVALKTLRQVCYMFYKLDIPYARETEAQTLADFVRTDNELCYESSALDSFSKHVLQQARKIILRVTANLDPAEGIPKHGPGAVATGEDPAEKHEFKRYYRRLAEVFPYDKWFLLNSSALCDRIEWLQTLEDHEAGTAKVVLVPKDSRGPRLISCEPLEYQWIQQALCTVLVDGIESHPLTRGRINFADQTRNRKLALEGSSLPFRWATLDMKEASDRVSLNLVKDLFSDTWFRHLYASRSDKTRLPDGTLVPLKKFAPMGSATCFPVESLIFWALSVAILMSKHNLPLRKAATKVYVYGDDVVCDDYYHVVLTQHLPQFGLLLNEGKCCVAGPFKESCGMDAFYGIPVTPAKIRRTFPIRPTSSSLQSWVAYSNAFHNEGLTRAAEYIREEIQAIMRSHRMHPVPTLASGEPSILAFVRPGCKVAVENSKRYLRYNTRLHRLEVLGYTYRPSLKIAKTEGWELALRVLSAYERVAPKTGNVLKDTPPPKQLLTGQFPIAHGDKLQRAWTPVA